MAIVHMQKVAILAHKNLRESILETLHEEGVLEVTATTPEGTIDHTEVNFKEAELQFAIDVLSRVASKDIETLARRPAGVKDVLKAVKQTDVLSIVERLHALEQSDTKLQGIIHEEQAMLAQLEPWSTLHEHPGTMAMSAFTESIPGFLPAASYEECIRALQEKVPRCHIEQAKVTDAVISCIATVWKRDHTAFEEIATAFGWTETELPALTISPADRYQQALKALQEAEAGKRHHHDERVKLAMELPALMRVAVFMRWLHEKRNVREAMNTSASTVSLTGWLPRDQMKALERKMQKISPAVAVLPLTPDEGEEAPVALKHRKLIAPFRSVTTLYGLPLPSEMDPTAALSPFFIVFFALCLTDAGYGAVLAILFGIVLWKTKKSVTESPLVWLLFFSGIVTILIGIPFGGWFGLTPDQVPEGLTKIAADGTRLFKGQIWNLGQQSGVNFLQYLSLALGLTHLMFGMFLSGFYKWTHGRKVEALWVDFTSHLLFAGIFLAVAAPYLNSPMITQYAPWLLWGSVALAVWGKGYGNKWYLRPLFGVLGLVNLAIGMLSNGLSYLRILALGLVTGAMALAVNQVAVEMGKLFPIWIAIPVIIVISVGGHLVSIALNTLGSFIHSGRLQFIEFFSQFFEGGGKPFTPFKRSTL